jgi:Na+-transporting methylmalonyl-CoA/oxaloacetate decarboxylase gamma subunit
MENDDTRLKKGVILLVLVALAAAICGMNAIYRRNVMKGEMKKLFSSVIINQVKDGVPIDSLKKNLEILKDIDSTNFTHDVNIMSIVINDYKRISAKDSVK